MTRLITGKRAIIGAGIVTIVAVASILAFHQNSPYSPTTFANIQRPTSRPACLQLSNNPSVPVSQKVSDAIGNDVTLSIIDVRAGTNVDVYFKTFNGTDVTGTAVYSGKYGTYNFESKKLPSESNNPYTLGWHVQKFKACNR